LKGELSNMEIKIGDRVERKVSEAPSSTLRRAYQVAQVEPERVKLVRLYYASGSPLRVEPPIWVDLEELKANPLWRRV